MSNRYSVREGDEEELDELLGRKDPKRVSTPARRLSDPIENENRIKANLAFRGLSRDKLTYDQQRMFTAMLRIPGRFHFSSDSESIYHLLLKLSTKLCNEDHQRLVESAFRTSAAHLASELEGMACHLSGSSYRKLAAKVRSGVLSESTIAYSAYAEGLEALRDVLSRMILGDNCDHEKKTLDLNTGTLELLDGVGFFTPLTSDMTFVLDRQQLLMIMDTVVGRRNVLLAATVGESVAKQIHAPLRLVQEIYNSGDAVLAAAGGAAYEALASWEGLFLGQLICKDDKLKIARYYLESVISTIKTTKVYLRNREARKALLSLISLVTQITERHHLSEAYGLFRSFGHPTVDIESACKKMQSVGCAPKIFDEDMLDTVAAQFIRRFIEVYIAKHRRWPEATYERPPGNLRASLVESLVTENQFQIPSHGPHYYVEDWLNVKFGQSFQVDLVDLIPDLIADRSISVPADEYDTVFEHKTVPYRTQKTTSKRRLITEFVNRSDLDIDAWMDQWRSGECPDRWKVLRVALKEREMKLEGRLYALTVFEVRMMLVALDHLTSKHVASLFPEISSYLSEKELKDLIQGRMSITGNLGWIPIVLNFDFKSWNLQFREMSTRRIFEVLDQVMGLLGSYTNIHPFFSECMFYATAQGKAPEGITAENRDNPPPSTMLWWNHLGGAEGLAQKAWNLVTLALVIYAKAVLGHDIVILGQGDNQVLLWRYRVEPGADVEGYLAKNADKIGTEVDRFFQQFCEITESWGLPVKKSEAWFSSSVFAFNKDVASEGVELPGSWKKISRVFAETENRLPTLQDDISTVCSGTFAATNHDLTAIPSLVIGYFVCLTVILRHDHWSFVGKKPMSEAFPHRGESDTEWRGISRDFLTLFLAMPQCLGGFMSMCFMGSYARGHSDEVTLGLQHCRSLYLANPDNPMYRKLCYYVFEKLELDPVPPDLRVLIEDPSSLNLTGGGTMKDLLLPLIRESIQRNPNEYTLPLGAPDIESVREEVYKALSTMNPYNPLVASEIYTRCIAGAADSILAGLQRAQTIQEVVPVRDFERIAKKVHASEVAKLGRMITLVLEARDPPAGWQPGCATETARKWRRKGWGVELESGTVAFALSYLHLHVEDEVGACRGKECLDSAFILTVDPTSRTSALGTPLHLASGKNRKYLGAATGEKKKSPVLEMKTRTSSVIDAQRLVEILLYVCESHSHLADLLKRLIAQRCGLSFDELTRCCSEIIGLKTHRFLCQRLIAQPLYNGRLNAEGFLQISVDNFHKVLPEDAGVLFQALYLQVYKHGAYYILAEDVRVGDSQVIIHGTLSCPCCVAKELDSTLELADSFHLSDVAKYRYLYATYVEVRTRDMGVTVPAGSVDRAKPEPRSESTYKIAVCALAYSLLDAGLKSSNDTGYGDRFDVTKFSVTEFSKVSLLQLAEHVGHYFAQRMFLPLFSTALAYGPDFRRYILLFAMREGRNIFGPLASILPMESMAGAREELLHEYGSAEGMQYGGKRNADLFLAPFLKGLRERLYEQAPPKILFISGQPGDAMSLISTFFLLAVNTGLEDRGTASMISLRKFLLQEVGFSATGVHGLKAITDAKDFLTPVQKHMNLAEKVSYTIRAADDWRRDIRVFPSKVPVTQEPQSSLPMIRGSVVSTLISGERVTYPADLVPFLFRTTLEQRKTPTYSHHAYKKYGHLSISAYHAVLLLAHFPVQGTVVVLGDSTGSVSRVLQAIPQVTAVYAQTMMDSSLFAPHRIAGNHLPEVSNGCRKEIMQRETELAIRNSDLSVGEGRASILMYCKQANVVFSDMEDFGNEEKARKALMGSLAIATEILDDDGLYIVRIYLDQSSLICGLLATMCDIFQEVKINRLTYLDETNGLVYLSGRCVGHRPLPKIRRAADYGLCFASGERYLSELSECFPPYNAEFARQTMGLASAILARIGFTPTWVPTLISLLGPQASLLSQRKNKLSEEILELAGSLRLSFQIAYSLTSSAIMKRDDPASKRVMAKPSYEERLDCVTSATRLLICQTLSLILTTVDRPNLVDYKRALPNVRDALMLEESFRTFSVDMFKLALKGTTLRHVVCILGQIIN